MPVIGTAGHVDHGKSTLVKALTGMDPDRLEEEKRRGLTIDLGFAWFTASSGQQVGIVDVPGHERFIKNMLAGAGAINLTLFVVAANEGWKPQSQEHLDIMDLLGISDAIVVISKIDTVDEPTVAGLEHTIRDKIEGTTLEGSTILRVSPVTGEGMDGLVAAIEALLAARGEEIRKRMRLWIDRVFTIRGSGTVVTGTLTGEPLHTDQEIEVLPGGQRARIRAIQSHQRELLFLGPGNRTALNLVGAEQEKLGRGDTITNPGAWKVTDHVVVSIRFLPQLDHEPQARGAYKFHVGSIELDASLRFLGETPKPGESGFASVRLARPTVLDFKDRFILRDSGRRQTVGGGEVLEAHPAGSFGRGPASLTGAKARLNMRDRHAYLEVLLEEEGYLAVKQIPVRTGVEADGARTAAIKLPNFVIAESALERFSEQIVDLARNYQTAHPLDPGMPLTLLRSELRLPVQLLNEVVTELIRRNRIRGDMTAVRTPEFAPRVEEPEKMRLFDELAAAGMSPPTLDQLSAAYGADMIRALIRSGELVQVSPNLVFTAEALQQIKHQIRQRVDGAGPFTVADFRDLVATSRKYAVPLLEYLDGIGYTTRRGDLRSLGSKA